MKLRVRHTARAILLTPSREVLLMRMRFPWHHEDLWIFPGGGLRDGETAADAIARELREETGMRPPRVDAEVWRCDYVVPSISVRAKERFFLFEIDRFEPKASDEIGEEADWLREFRWWPVDALTQASIRVEPPGVLDFMAELVHR